MIIFSWIVFSFVAGYIGSSRSIGFWGAFLLSLILSPLIGLIFALTSEKRKVVSREHYKLIVEGDKLMEKGEIDMAISKFSHALKYPGRAPRTNFKLAKLYSLKQDNPSAFRHLALAVEDGFRDFDKINSDPALEGLRSDPFFEKFSLTGFRSISVLESVPNKYDELEKLNGLLEKGILSKEEFEEEKKKILLRT